MSIFKLILCIYILNLSCSNESSSEQQRSAAKEKNTVDAIDATKIETTPPKKTVVPIPPPPSDGAQLPIPVPESEVLQLKSLGIIGDSDTDEFRANDNRGGVYSAITFNWIELLVNQRNITLGPWESNPEPRRSGYAYNWARSGAVAQSMINSGQHTGVAAQIAAKKVNFVIVRIGVNDFHPFNGTYEESYSNQSDAQLDAKVNSIINNLNTAIATVVNAATQTNERIGVLVTHYGDPATSSLTAPLFSDANKRARVTAAIQKINQAIDHYAVQYPKIVYPISQLPYINFTEENLTIASPYPYITLGPGRLLYYNMNNHPQNLIMADKHLGTIANGLIFNLLYQKPLKDHFGINIQPFSNDELYELVGLD